MKMKICVTEVINRETAERKVGIFEWTGRSWMNATMGNLIEELPLSSTSKERNAAYKRVKKELIAKGVKIS
jgi:hypothetical protein